MNDLMTLSFLDIDIPEEAYYNVLGRGGHGLGGVFKWIVVLGY
jgi:hypothetical protein